MKDIGDVHSSILLGRKDQATNDGELSRVQWGLQQQQLI
jgi:hypothetical protein